ncbi:MAG: hypothetical protein IJY26_01110 [Clostridia bacterium]|nr:hypothetical protein [Clostridia bacterium]
MKVSCIVCSTVLILFGFFSLVYALFSYDLLFTLCFSSPVVYRIALSFNAVSAAWLAFWLIAFRPQNNLN